VSGAKQWLVVNRTLHRASAAGETVMVQLPCKMAKPKIGSDKKAGYPWVKTVHNLPVYLHSCSLSVTKKKQKKIFGAQTGAWGRFIHIRRVRR